MKNFIVNSLMIFIKKHNDLSEIKLLEIRYGLASIYLVISKLIILSTISIILGIFIEFIIFTLIYNLIKMPSFGLHATKSWICLVSSILFFIGIPLLAIYLNTPLIFKSILGIIGILLIYKNAPADTIKKPIIDKKRREKYKFISTSIAIVFVFCSLYITNNFINDCFLYALLLQCGLTSPLVYKIFGLSYDNYKIYISQTVVA